MVSTQEKMVFGESDPLREEQTYCLQTPLPPVHIVPEEKVVGLPRDATLLEEAEEIMVLPVRVASNLDGRLDLEKH